MNASKNYSRPWSADPRGSSYGESLDARREQLVGAEPSRPTRWCTLQQSRAQPKKRPAHHLIIEWALIVVVAVVVRQSLLGHDYAL